MGVGKSKTTAEFITDISLDVLVENAQKVKTKLVQTGIIEAKAGSIIEDVKIQQKMDVIQMAIAANINELDIQNKIMAKIQQQAQSKGTWGGISISGADTKLKNLIKETFTVKNLQQCGTNASQSAIIRAVDSSAIRKASIEQILNTFQKCIQNTITNNKAYASLDADLSQTVKAVTTSPIDTLLNFFKSTVGIILLIIIGIIIFIFIFGGKILGAIFGKKKSSSETSGPPTSVK